MPKILILCYDYPPLNSAGAARPYAWFKNARTNGFEPVVVSRRWPFPVNNITDRYKTIATKKKYEVSRNENGVHYEINHKNTLKEKLLLKYGPTGMPLLRKFISLAELLGRFMFPAWLDEKYEMYIATDEIIQIEKPDVLIVTGEPHIMFTYAQKLKKKHGLPYILDYRDGWHTNHTRNREGMLNKWIERIELKYEIEALKKSLFFTSVTTQLINGIQQKVLNHPGYAIPNGVDLSTSPRLKATVPNDKFVLVNTGTLYDLAYDTIFETGIKKFINTYNPTDFEVNFYGLDLNPNRCVEVIKRISAELQGIVNVHPRQSHSAITLIQQSATVLLNMIPGSHEKGIINMKTYEYLATHRPIIVVPNEPSKKTSIFPDKNYQVFALTGDEFADVLGSFYERYKKGEDLSTAISDEELYTISREKSSKELFEEISKHLK